MIFYKTVAAGNDFLHVDTAHYQTACPNAPGAQSSAPPGPLSKERLSFSMCRPHTGAGADGVVFYAIHPPTADRDDRDGYAQFDIYNRDGTRAELSGNGMAGLSALLFYLGHFNRRVTLHTRVGKRTHYLQHRDGTTSRMLIEIGPPDFNNHVFFPFLKEGVPGYHYDFSHVDSHVDNHVDDHVAVHVADNGAITFYPVSMGNPHVVVLLDEPKAEDQLEAMGKTLESAPVFPHKTNVAFVWDVVVPSLAIPSTVSGASGVSGNSNNSGDSDYPDKSANSAETGEPSTPDADEKNNTATCRVFYYERGVGRTLSSSTGSAAVFSVLRRVKGIPDQLVIDTGAGGKIKIKGKDSVYIENSAKIVYKGVWLD